MSLPSVPLNAMSQAVARNAVALGQHVALDEMALAWEVRVSVACEHMLS